MRIEDYRTKRDSAQLRGMMFVLITCRECGEDGWAEFPFRGYTLERVQEYFATRGWTFTGLPEEESTPERHIPLCPKCSRRR